MNRHCHGQASQKAGQNIPQEVLHGVTSFEAAPTHFFYTITCQLSSSLKSGAIALYCPSRRKIP